MSAKNFVRKKFADVRKNFLRIFSEFFLIFLNTIFSAIIYCFTNREVQTVLKNCYNRHRLKHSRPLDRHKGGGSHYTQIASKYNNNNNSSSNGINNNNDNEKQRGGKLVSGGQIASVDSGERFLFIRSKMIQELEEREGGNDNIKQLYV